MKPKFNLVLFIALLPGLMLALNDPMSGKHTKEKKIERSFDVNKNAKLKIDNRFGNVDITTWNQNKIEITVIVTTNGNNEQEVQRRLDEITVEFSGSKSQVTAQTKIGSSKSGWSIFGNRSGNVNMKINYSVKMPAANSLDLRNDYGAINLNKINGDARITCNYGSFIIGELLGSNNTLNFDYTTSATIGKASNLTINADYSEFVLNEGENVIFKGNYTRSEFKEITSALEFEGSYGRLTVGKAKNFNGKTRYVTSSFESITGYFGMNSNYGKITIDLLEKSFSNVVITARYTNIDISYSSGASFDLSTKLSYANLRVDDNIEFTLRSIQNTKSEYEGYYGKKSSGKNIQITSDYGNVRLQKK
jgi:hypothetical protein